MLEVVGVSKYFGGYKVLDNISFTLGRGRAAVLIGRNGSGKTTLLRCVAGLLRYEGFISIEGVDVSRDPVNARKRIGYLPQIPPVKGDITGYEIFDFYTDLHGIDLDADKWFEMFGLEDAMDLPLDGYSGGMRQRLFLMMAIAHEPVLTILDEPMNNLDSLGKTLLVDIINNWKKMGRSFLLSGHRLTDFIVYADEVILLDDGRIIYHGSIAPLFEVLGFGRIHIYSPNGSLEDVARAIGGELLDRNRLIIHASDIHMVLKSIVDMGIRSFFLEEPTIDAIIARLKGDE